MAYFSRHKKGWRAQLSVNGKRASKVFDTKGRAEAWAVDKERRLRGWSDPQSHILSDALERFRDEVSPLRKGYKWEKARINKLCRDSMADVRLDELIPAVIAEWRDRRLQEVSAGSVRREMALLAGVFSYCTQEWGWLEISPLKAVRKPPAPQHRDRRISPKEEAALILALPEKVATIFQIALETAMRLGEICSIEPSMVRGKFVRLEDTKNGTRREVPLSTKARDLLAQLDNKVGISSAYVSRTFSLTCRELKIKDLRFHDSRHEAFTRLSKKLSVMELARMAGMKDTRTLMIYFNATASDIADKLG